MRLGLIHGYSGGKMEMRMDLIEEAEKLGFDSIWTSEAYGNDAVTTATWILARTSKIKVGTAIMQMPARTPACTAMTAMSLQAMSGNRFLLGLGPSGPQVVEGWHGAPFGKPLKRTKEYISIIRQILKREAPLEHQGEHYSIPYQGEGATGLGKPLKSILHGDPSLPIYTASITPGGMRTAGQVADGVFPIWMAPEKYDVFGGWLEEGFTKAGNGKSLKDFDVAPFVSVSVGDDLDKCRAPIKARMALYIGGMGARDKNFYNDYTTRMGYPDEAKKIQDLFLGGKKDEAAAAVPDALVDEVALVGPKERIRDRLQAWKEASSKGHVGSMLLRANDVESLRIVAEAAA